ncbi:MAG: MFS transporter, partial [Bacillota bacterium]
SARPLPRAFWFYILFSVAAVAGYAHFQLISYHFKAQNVVGDVYIPLLYAMAMGVDAMVALIAGRLYDRVGMGSLVAVPLLALPLPWLIFGASYLPALAGIMLWGAIMGIQETTMRAAIADMTAPERRGLAYGIFNTAYGGAWMLGSAVLGYLYEVNLLYVTVFIVALELLALPLLYLAWRNGKRANGSTEGIG